MIFTILILLFFWIITAGMTPFAQFKISHRVQEFFTNKIKINKLKFLFRGISGAEVDKDGIIKPMFIMHILGYLATFSLIIVTIVMYIVIDADLESKNRTIVLTNFSGMLLVAAIFIIFTSYVKILSQRNNKKV